jgi:hypothetical protein
VSTVFAPPGRGEHQEGAGIVSQRRVIHPWSESAHSADCGRLGGTSGRGKADHHFFEVGVEMSQTGEVLSASHDQDASSLLQLVDQALEYVYRRMEVNKKRASSLKLLIVILTGISTMLLGLQIQGAAEPLKQTAFVLVSLATVLSALEPFFNFRAQWVEHEIAAANFHMLKDELQYRLRGGSLQLKADELGRLFERYQMYWNQLNRSLLLHRGGDNTLVGGRLANPSKSRTAE